jgi:hypothetical protein
MNTQIFISFQLFSVRFCYIRQQDKSNNIIIEYDINMYDIGSESVKTVEMKLRHLHLNLCDIPCVAA